MGGESTGPVVSAAGRFEAARMTAKVPRRAHGRGSRRVAGPAVATAAAERMVPLRDLPPAATRIAPAALRAALAAIPGPAYLVRAPARIVCGNARGAALLAAERDRVHDALRHPPGAAASAAHRFPVSAVKGWFIVVLRDLPGNALARLPTIARRWSLTPRQSAVLLLVAEGASNRGVAERLACSEKTVELHVSALLAKTRSTNRSRLVASFWTEPP